MMYPVDEHKEATSTEVVRENEKQYRLITVFPDGFERDEGTADVNSAFRHFWGLQELMLTMQAARLRNNDQAHVGLKVVEVGTDKVVARLDINPPDKKKAFAALSSAIEETGSKLPEQTYRDLYEKAKDVFDMSE